MFLNADVKLAYYVRIHLPCWEVNSIKSGQFIFRLCLDWLGGALSVLDTADFELNLSLSG